MLNLYREAADLYFFYNLIADVCAIVILTFVLKAVLVPLLPYGFVGIPARSVSERGRSLSTCALLSLPMEARSSS